MSATLIPLQLQEIATILRYEHYTEEDMKRESWIDWQQLYKLVVNRYKTELTMNGKSYQVRDRTEDIVFIMVEEGFAPCGWFSYKQITDMNELPEVVLQ